jgi:hypothetical protein
VVLVAAAVAQPPTAAATALRFLGTGAGDVDRVKVRIDGPPAPADVGTTDFTLEWWMKALPGDNAAGDAQCGSHGGWSTGSVLFDRDIVDDGEHGEYGVSLTGGRIAFGVSAGGAGTTICGATDVADGTWHHVAVTRARATGLLRLYVDGVLDAEGAGGVGSSRDVSYADGRATDFPDVDPFLVVGAAKRDAAAGFPSYEGWLDEVRLSSVRRYTGAGFTRPALPFVPDGATAALYHLDEAAGDVVGDASGGGSHGLRRPGGDPAGPAWSGDAAPLDAGRRMALEPVVAGLGRPVGIAHAGDARLFVVEADGRVLVHDGASTGTFLDIVPLVRCCGEEGLLGLAFHPDYAANGYFFVYYTNKSGDNVVARYRRSGGNPAVGDPGSGRILLTIPHPDFGNHNGGALAFGPDGYLYVGVGDGGSGGDPDGHGQSLDTWLGKILRLHVGVDEDADPPYTIPPTNPFVGGADTRPEIWAYGLRNPWRITFDRVTGDLFIGDVGQGAREEVDFQPATGAAGEHGGRNYGWRRMEGTACFNPSTGCQTGSLVLPILEYTHAEGCSVTGGYRYRGAAVPLLHGVYLFADFCTGEIWGGVQAGDGGWGRIDLLDTPHQISSFGEDAAGELYVADIGGTVYRIVAARPRLTVTRVGSGAGTVVSGPAGIACGTACSAEYDPGTLVSLTALPGAGSTFVGWGGACGGTGACVVTLGGDRAVSATFLPKAIVQFSAPAYSAREGRSQVTVTVTRSGNTAGPVTVTYALVPGTAAAGADYGIPPGSQVLGFGPGVVSRKLSIPIVNNSLAESAETLLVVLSQPTGGAELGPQHTAVVTITDNDPGGSLQFSASAYKASEGAGAVTVTVRRSRGRAGGVSVDVIVAGGTATAGADYVFPAPVTLAFAAGQGSRSFTIPIVQDALDEPEETIVLALQQPRFATLGTRKTATVRLIDDDPPAGLQVGQAEETAGGPGDLVLARAGGAPARPGAVPVTAAWSNGRPDATPGAASPVRRALALAPGAAHRTRHSRARGRRRGRVGRR